MVEFLIVCSVMFILILPFTIQLGMVFYHCFKGEAMWGEHWSKGRSPDQYGWVFDNGFEFRGDDILTQGDLYYGNIPSQVREPFLDGGYALLEFDIFLMDYAFKFRTENQCADEM